MTRETFIRRMEAEFARKKAQKEREALMHDTFVKMKDGRTFSGPVGKQNSEEGWLILWAQTEEDIKRTGHPEGKLYFRDMESCGTPDERIGPNKIGNDDLLARARRNGWDGT